MAAIPGLAQGFLNFAQQDQARQEAAMRMRLQAEQLAAAQQLRQRQLAATQQAGGVLGQMYPQAPQGLPPPPAGTPQGGPMPPPPGQASMPSAPPMPPAAPMPPAIQPFRPLPQGPQAGGAAPAPMAPPPMAGPVPPPPPMQPPAAPPGMPAPGMQPQQPYLPQIIAALRAQNVPTEQWADVLDRVAPVVKDQIAVELRESQAREKVLKDWLEQNYKQGMLGVAQTRVGIADTEAQRRATQGMQRLQIYADKERRLAAGKGAGGAAAPLDDNALDIQAWNYINGKGLPYRKGTGGGVDRNDAVMRRAGVIAKELNMTPQELAATSADFKANASSLTTATRKLDAIGAQLKSFHNNIQTWDNIARGLPPTIGSDQTMQWAEQLRGINFIGVQSLDDVKLKIQQQINDPSVVAYLVSAMAVAMDYGRIMTGPQSAAQLTEGARKDAERLIAAGTNNEARKGIIAALDSDTIGQQRGLEEQTNAIRERMGMRPGGMPKVSASGRPMAPPAAVEYLKSHPELKDEFQKKYGYLPAGVR